MTTDEHAFELVFVCTGNRFRSPLAAALMQNLTADLSIRVLSVGTLSHEGLPALKDAVDLGRELGIDLDAHRSRTLVGVDLSNADLVVGFERRHVAAAIVESGAERERTFGAYELSELLARIEPPAGLTPTEHWREIVGRAHIARALPTARPSRELPDPAGRGREVAFETLQQVQDLVGRIAFGLFGIFPERPVGQPKRQRRAPGRSARGRRLP